MNCLYFICERKFYARTHVKITPHWKSTLIEASLRGPLGRRKHKKASLNRVKLRVNVNASSLIFLYKIDSHGGIMHHAGGERQAYSTQETWLFRLPFAHMCYN